MNLTYLQHETDQILGNFNIISLIFDEKFISFQFDWIDKNGFVKNICLSYAYIFITKNQLNFQKSISKQLKKELKNEKN